MSASPLIEQMLFGLYELDPTGIVLYSRVETESETDAARTDVNGRDFYEEVASFDNVEELRQRIRQFTRSNSPADSFRFDCLYDGQAQSVRVLLARVRERAGEDRTRSVLVHIRKST